MKFIVAWSIREDASDGEVYVATGALGEIFDTKKEAEKAIHEDATEYFSGDFMDNHIPDDIEGEERDERISWYISQLKKKSIRNGVRYECEDETVDYVIQEVE